jgi:NAD(P)-dependent dehydrogenase (short-subunit alcohol dehydrogenase family)
LETTRFKGRIAVITGAHQGIGRGVAERLGAEGAHVVCLDLEDCAETMTRITESGGTAERATMDVTDLSQWRREIERIDAHHGRIDVLGNIAGVVATTADTAVDIEQEQWDRMISHDLTSVWYGMKTVLPLMIRNGYGRILNIASLAALRGLPNLFSYSAAKAGVTGMTRQAAVEYAGTGVTINAIAPGTINTPILADITPEMLDQFAAAHAIKRLGTPADIAAMAAYLCSPEADFITGMTYPVDGGWSIV